MEHICTVFVFFVFQHVTQDSCSSASLVVSLYNPHTPFLKVVSCGGAGARSLGVGHARPSQLAQ